MCGRLSVDCVWRVVWVCKCVGVKCVGVCGCGEGVRRVGAWGAWRLVGRLRVEVSEWAV